MFISKFVNFLKLDIRWKLVILTKFTKINFYPPRFHLNGWKSIYSKIIFFLIFNQEKKFRKITYRSIFFSEEKKISDVIIALPRSGSNLLRNLITSYISLKYKISDGIPKYNPKLDIWQNQPSTIFNADMYNAVNTNYINLKLKEFIEKRELIKKKIYFSRHPIQKADLIDIHKSNSLLLLRNPKDLIYSWISTKSFLYQYSEKQYLSELRLQINKNLYFLEYWKNYFTLNKKVRFCIIDFNDLTQNTKISFKKILNFFKYEINEEVLNNCVEINSKENYKKYMANQNSNSVRFMNKKINNVKSDIFTKHFHESLIKKNLEQYSFLKNLSEKKINKFVK